MRKMVCKKVRKRTSKELEQRMGHASVLLFDYDGYYCPKSKKGDAEKLASLIDDAFYSLQGFHWDRKVNAQYAAREKRNENHTLRNR